MALTPKAKKAKASSWDAMPKELDNKERRFVSEYLIDLDPQRAALAAGYSETVARSKAYQWVSNSKTKPHVFAAVQNAMQTRSERTDITADRVLKELAKIGFADIRRAIKWQGTMVTEEDNPDGGDTLVIKNVVTNNVTLVSSDEIDDETAAAISEISQNAAGGIKLKMHDKKGALVDIGRHLGMFVEKHEHTGAGGGPIQTETRTWREVLRQEGEE